MQTGGILPSIPFLRTEVLLWGAFHSPTGLSLENREREGEGGAAPRLRFDPDAPPMSLHDPFADGETDARTRVFLPGMEPLKDDENALGVFRFDPDAVVGDGENPFMPFPP